MADQKVCSRDSKIHIHPNCMLNYQGMVFQYVKQYRDQCIMYILPHNIIITIMHTHNMNNRYRSYHYICTPLIILIPVEYNIIKFSQQCNVLAGLNRSK